MLNVFFTVVLPIFLVASSGALLQRLRPGVLGMLGPAALYLLSPALVLDGLLETNLSADVSLKIIAATVSAVISMAAVSWLVSKLLKHDRPTQSAFLLTGTFANAGNMGLPIAYLAFGEEGLAVAILIFVAQGSLSWPLGIYLAARGRTKGWQPLIKAIKVPTLYAVPLALIIRAFGWDLPQTFDTTISLMADATIPAMLLVLGYQLAQGIQLDKALSLGSALFTRLVLGAIISIGLAELFGLDGTARNTVVVVSAMPTAVFTTILATEFQAMPRFVASAVVTSTLASLITLTVLIDLLQKYG
ncbi:MAG: hypothetical protein CL777_03015 [Chloroflexi bacterium]|nr:hypothetical protein [Chloroflexota bacterium]MBI67699.1 hypothetical protein [Chloroflexota bacterium]MCH2532525.1 AEC family transporter [Dehalococcoidia bacterium]HCH35123.1 hypothetical protein [Dehalococcoidia bacterium]